MEEYDSDLTIGQRSFPLTIYLSCMWLRNGTPKNMPIVLLVTVNAMTKVTVKLIFSPSNAEATFVQSTRMQSFLKTILTLSCWYSLDSSQWVLSDEYPCVRVSIIFSFFASFCISQISHQQQKGPASQNLHSTMTCALGIKSYSQL